MRLKWSDDAVNDLKSLRQYIEKDKPGAARQVALGIVTAIKDLLKNPHIGRPGRVPHTRELVIPGTPFIVPYRGKRDVLEVLRVLHGAMQWPGRF